METSVMTSWITEAGLSVQALAKKAKKPLAHKTKLASTKEVITLRVLLFIHYHIIYFDVL